MLDYHRAVPDLAWLLFPAQLPRPPTLADLAGPFFGRFQSEVQSKVLNCAWEQQQLCAPVTQERGRVEAAAVTRWRMGHPAEGIRVIKSAAREQLFHLCSTKYL